jgi:hypothetical protein
MRKLRDWSSFTILTIGLVIVATLSAPAALDVDYDGTLLINKN